MDKNDIKTQDEEIEKEGIDEEIEEDAKDSEKEILEKRVEELENTYKRALADYQNLEKRQIDERKNWIIASNRELLLRLLPVLDTLHLASQHSADKSLQVSIHQFLDVLKAEGVTKIDTVGKKFDPNLMEAIDTKEGEDGRVIGEVLTGYVLHDTLLRAAQVIVGSARQNKKDN